MQSTHSYTTALDLAKGTIDPLRYGIQPPSAYTATTFTKRIDASGNFPMLAMVPTYQGIPSTSGAIIWMPNRGLNSVYRFGIIPGGTETDYHGVHGHVLPGSNTLPTGITGPAFGDGFHFHTPLPVPYNDKTSADIIHVSPPMDDLTISKARLYAGYLRTLSDTTPVGLTALNGSLSAAAVGDIRDVFQTGRIDNVDSGAALDAVTLVQSSVLMKDAIKEVSVGKGATVLIGPDISPAFTDVDHGTRRTFLGSEMQQFIMGNHATVGHVLAADTSADQWMGFVSPWNISLTGFWQDGVGAHIPFENFQTSPINPIGGVLNVEVLLAVTGRHTQGNPGYVEQWTVSFVHYFATCSSSDGALWINMGIESHSLLSHAGNATTFPRFMAKSNAKQFMNLPFNKWNNQTNFLANEAAGMYIGTQIVISTKNVSMVAGTLPCMYIDSNKPPTVKVWSQSDQDVGELGPCRIVRYEGLSEGMAVRLDGTFLAECIPGATTAPFVQAAGAMSKACDNMNAMPFVSYLYNTPESPFRRVWQNDQWELFFQNVLPKFNCQQLRSFAPDRLVAAAVAAGVLVGKTCEEIENDTKDGVVVPVRRGLKRAAAESVFSPGKNEIQPMSSAMSCYSCGPGPTTISDRVRAMDQAMEPIARASARGKWNH